MPDAASTTHAESLPRTSLARLAVIGALLGALLACGAEIGRMVGDRNKHVVMPGRVYRSGQLNPQQLEQFVAQHGIKTVVNLRGRPFSDWYPAESRTTQGLGVSQEDVTTSANRLPPTGEIRRLIDVFDNTEYPILIHCQQGADRTGLASAMYQLLHTDADYSAARRQCMPRFGHVPIHTALAMDEFFDQYEEWLTARGETHTPARFRHWATSEYCPGPGRARLVLIDPPVQTETGRPFVFTLRAYNTSREVWQLTAGTETGIHATYVVVDAAGRVAHTGLAGLLDARVAPGAFIDLTLPVPALTTTGRFTLWVDLAQRNVSFTQYGSEPLTHDWEARDPAALRGR